MKFSIKRFIIYILVYIFLFQDTILYYFNNSVVNSLDEFFILLYAIIAIFYCVKTGRINKTSFIIFILSILYLIIGLISGVMNSNYQIYTLIMGGFLVSKIYILVFSIINLPIKKDSSIYIVEALKLAAFICALVGIFNFVLPNLYLKIFPFGFSYYRMGFTSVMSLFIHPGIYGWFMLFIAFYYFSEYTRKKEKKQVLSFIFFSVMAILSFKVKVIMAILLVVLLYIYVIENRKVKAPQIFTTIGLLSIIWFFFGKLIYNTYTLYFTQTDTISARYALSYTSLEILRDYFPLGVGFGKFASWFARINYSEFYYKYGINNVYGLDPQNAFFGTDTFWPAVLGETGFLGFVVYCILLAYIFIKLLSIYKNNKENHYSLFAILIFVQAVVESSGEPIFNSSPQNIIIGVILGLALSKRKGYNAENRILYA